MKLLLLLLLTIFSAALNGQDYLVTWTNDTVACTFPERPGKEGLKPAIKFENGHIRAMATFPGDSVRVIEAGAIKAYYRKEHGRHLLCNGFFESRKVVDRSRLFADRYDKRGNATGWYFMNRVVVGKYATLYVLYIMGNKYPVPVYFLSKYNDADPLVPTMIGGKNKLKDIIADEDVNDGMDKFLTSKKAKSYTAVVKEYNRLKEAALLKME